MQAVLCSRKRLLVLASLLAAPLLVLGQDGPSPSGSQYAIAGRLPGDQSLPQAAVNSSGGFLVWQDNSATPAGLRIKAEQLNGVFTAAGAPFLVSSVNPKSKNTGDQSRPQVALTQSGGAIVVWQGGPAGRESIFARFIAPNGAPLKRDLTISRYRKGYQSDPCVATLSNGTIVIVWSSYGEDGSRLGVFGQLFSDTGRTMSKEFQVNQFTANNQRTPAVAALANGGFAIVWISELQPVSTTVIGVADVYARLFDSSGNPLGQEFRVNTSTTNICANPVVAGASSGGFAVAWSQKADIALVAGGDVTGAQSSLSLNSWDVFGRVFAAGGASTAAPFVVNTYTYGDQFGPRISASGTNYLAVWTSLGQDGSWEGVYGQSFADSGDLEGSEFRVNTTTISRQIQPTVTADGVNRYLTVWSSFGAGTGFDLFAQMYQQ